MWQCEVVCSWGWGAEGSTVEATGFRKLLRLHRFSNHSTTLRVPDQGKTILSLGVAMVANFGILPFSSKSKLFPLAFKICVKY